MNFFDVLGKIIDVAKEERDRYVNVTKDFPIAFPTEIGKYINLESDKISLHISHSDNGVGFAIYLYEPYDVSYVRIECETKNDVTYFKSHCSSSFIKGYIELSMPDSDVVTVKTIAGNIVLSGVTANESEINTETGNVVLKTVNLSKANVCTRNGNITVKNIETNNLSLETNYGNIVLKISPDTYNISAKTERGNIVKKGVTSISEPSRKIEVSTKTGNIVIKDN